MDKALHFPPTVAIREILRIEVLNALCHKNNCILEVDNFDYYTMIPWE